MPPTAPIDSDINGTTLYVLETGGLWKGTPVGSGAAAWTQVLSAATFTDLANLAFSRVRCAGGVLYVLGGTAVSGETTGDAYFFVSHSGGLTWSYYLIEADAFEVKPYTVSVDSVAMAGDAYDCDFDRSPIDVELTHVRSDGDETHNPFAVAATVTGNSGTYGAFGSWTTGMVWVEGAATDLVDGAYSSGYLGAPTTRARKNSQLTAGESIEASEFLDDFFGAGGYSLIGAAKSMPKEAGRTKRNYKLATQTIFIPQGAVTATWNLTSYAFFKFPSGTLPIALDFAPGNHNWIYVGTEDKIYKSTNGGATWSVLLADAGANDICVDPQLAGAIYAWRTGGSLDLIVNGAVNASLDTETPVRLPLRLARSLNSGRLWAIKGGTDLRLRNLGSWTDLQSSLVNGRGLHAYVGGKLIFLDGANIWTSEDYGATVTARKGAWAYANGINAHRIAV